MDVFTTLTREIALLQNQMEGCSVLHLLLKGPLLALWVVWQAGEIVPFKVWGLVTSLWWQNGWGLVTSLWWHLKPRC